MNDGRPERTSGREILRKFCTRLIVVWRRRPQSRLLSAREREPRSVTIMKIQALLSASVLAIATTCLAEEPNPFVAQEPKKAPSEASGDSFVTLTEHILVPADQLDAWLEKHPLTDDASSLRAAAQTWIKDGTTKLDHTAVSTGTRAASMKMTRIGNKPMPRNTNHRNPANGRYRAHAIPETSATT